MENEKHDPKTSTAVIIKYLRKNPEKKEVVKEVAGEKNAVKELKLAQKTETKPDQYRYLWQWKNLQAAQDYFLEQLEKGK